MEVISQKGLELEEAYLEIAKTLTMAVEARDPYTRGHSERLTQLAQEIAADMGCSEKLIRDIQIAGRLHDIGKIGIPDSILLKPGPLTAAEWAEIQQHPVKAIEMIRFLGSLRDVFPLIEGHHERFDGKGYPNRLKGEQISLGARILAVADAYEAMTSERAHRSELTPDEALDELEARAGTHHSSEIVVVLKKQLVAQGDIAEDIACDEAA